MLIIMNYVKIRKEKLNNIYVTASFGVQTGKRVIRWYCSWMGSVRLQMSFFQKNRERMSRSGLISVALI